jgi:hypothetical protein
MRRGGGGGVNFNLYAFFFIEKDILKINEKKRETKKKKHIKKGF